MSPTASAAIAAVFAVLAFVRSRAGGDRTEQVLALAHEKLERSLRAEITESQRGLVTPAEISIFEDRSFTFVPKTPPTPFLLRQAAGIEKGAQNPRTDTAGTVTKAQVRQIAETKMPDLNAIDLDGAVLQVEGTARSMGIKVTG